MGPLQTRGYCHDFGFACEQEAEAYWLQFCMTEVAEGGDQRAQHVDAEILRG
jgi:hypothetical protein